MAAKGKSGPNPDVYKQFFKDADKNGDGYLSVQELRDVFKQAGSHMSDRQIADIFVFFDGPQGDRRITFEEFCNGLEQIMKFIEGVKQLFTELDTSGDGFLSRDELTVLLNKCGKSFTPEEVTDIMKQADTNGDNHISLEEFLNALT